MLYLLNGNESFLIKKEIKTICSSFSKESINHYDLTETKIEDILEDASMISMFSEKKIIIVDNSEIFESKENVLVHNTDEYLKYLTNPNPDTTLVFISRNEKLDERKKVTKKTKETAIIKTFNKEKNIYNLVSKMFDGYKISNNDINFFIERTGNDLELISNEIEKLKNYILEEKEIIREDIENLIHKNIDLDIFSLIDNIVSRKKEPALEQYYEMIKRNEEPIKIIILIAGQLRLMYQSLELSNKGYTEKDIATTLSVHPYRVKLAVQKARNYKSDRMLNLISNLASLDENIKRGKTDKNTGLEMFILTI